MSREKLLSRLVAGVAIGLWAVTPVRAAGEQWAACTACHGANGMSISDDIPNLAGQRAGYLGKQLEAFRAETRKNPLMNAIATQLSDEDIALLAGHFSALAAGAKSERSAVADTLAEPKVVFPSSFPGDFSHYHTIDFPDRKQVRYYYANRAALQGARNGGAVPDGAMTLVEVYKAKLDADGNPVRGADGHFEKDTLSIYTAMAKGAGWGEAVPAELRNGDWRYAIFSAEGVFNPKPNYATCFACHKPLDGQDYLFTIEQITAQAKKMP